MGAQPLRAQQGLLEREEVIARGSVKCYAARGDTGELDAERGAQARLVGVGGRVRVRVRVRVRLGLYLGLGLVKEYSCQGQMYVNSSYHWMPR